MVTAPELSPTLSALLARRDLKLRLISAPEALPDGALERSIRWVHSSDLADPTPFLADDVVLLTTGTQFRNDDDADAAGDALAYVARLASRGVIALGFGTEVVRAGVPSSLAEACAVHGMALFEVPYRTPFIALARANSEAIAAQAYARRSWALQAQRAISLAALRPDGLGATLAELSKQLDTWVGMYDASGALVREHPTGALDGEVADALGDEVGVVLRRGARAGSALAISGIPFTLQTLGRGGHLRGVIAIASPELDQEGRGVVTSVIAMAGLALEQHQGLARARETMRAGVVDLLRAGNATLARRIARTMGSPLPSAPFRVLVADRPTNYEAFAEWLELRAAEQQGSVFFARREQQVVLVVPAQSLSFARDVAKRFEVGVGVSDVAAYDGFDDAVAQALLAHRRGGGGVTMFSDANAQGVLATLSDDARVVASAVLAPLLAHDAAEGTALTETLRAFLEHDGSNEATASALGVHRHTVRARVQSAQRVLGVSLATFPERAEVWAAFVATDAARSGAASI